MATHHGITCKIMVLLLAPLLFILAGGADTEATSVGGSGATGQVRSFL
jgi:hypothetical protein